VQGSYSNVPSTTGTTTGGTTPAAGGTYGNGTSSNGTFAGGGVSTLPTTGGATPSSPSFPFLPVLAGLALTILGVCSRKLALAIR
jgi:hypothetical protein